MKVIIVGGVAGGASTAARLRRLDESAEIILFEKTEYVSYANCGLPYHISKIIPVREQLLVQTADKLQANLNLDVRTSCEVTDISTEQKTVRVLNRNTNEEYEESWDKLVLCPGGVPIRPPTPGDDIPGIFTLQNVENMDAIIAKINQGAVSAVVIGGGFIGIEMTENFVERGIHVDLIEKGNQILAPFDSEMASELECHMVHNSVRLHKESYVTAFERGDNASIRCRLDNDVIIQADIVISAIGVRPSTDLAKKAGLTLGPSGGIQVNEHMQTSNPDIYAAGDAVEVVSLTSGLPVLIPLAGPANRQGRVVADNLAGRKSKFSAVQGTSILQVFDMTAASTGANEKMLKMMSMPYKKIYLHPPGHAGYYPGTAAMHMKVLFSPDEGKLLGAQICGYDGVDKRIDVLAVAIRAEMTVFDLEELELAYAPPYGSAKDPVNMVGFVGQNILTDDVPTKYVEDIPDFLAEGQVVDVREPDEYCCWHIAESINIPLSEVRDRIKTLDQKKPTLIYCRSGIRSYLALCIFKSHGFNNVYNLSGGALSFAIQNRDICTGKRLSTYEFIPASGNEFEVDARGISFPDDIKLLRDKLHNISVGDEVIVHFTGPMLSNIIPAWCNGMGHMLIDSYRTDDRGIVFRVRRGIVI